MKIKLFVIGKIKEKYWNDAICEYKKRLNAFCELSLIELKEINTDDINKNIIEEGRLILNSLKEDDFLITLEILGNEYSSEEFASFINKHYLYDNRTITFVIGGSNGLSKEILSRSNMRISFGRFTYPHQLMRVILLEQIYRAMMINNNRAYHK